MTFKWEGSVDYDEVAGELQLPYVSEDVDDGAYELKWTMKDAKDDSHKKAVKFLQKQEATIKEGLKTFAKEIFAK